MPLTSDSTRRSRRAGDFRAVAASFVRTSGQDLIEYAFLAAFVGMAGYAGAERHRADGAATVHDVDRSDDGTPSLWEPADPWTSPAS